MAGAHDPKPDPQAITDALQRAIDLRENVQVRRPALAHPTWNGFPLALGDDLVLLRSLHEFAVNGFAVMRLGDIAEVLRTDAERFFARVLRAEGTLDRSPPARAVPLRSWRSVLEVVRAQYRFAIVECERPDGADFFLGELAGVDDDELTLHYIQVNGTRERALTRVPLDDITLVRFDERYVNLFGRYAVSEDHH
jgi:hypothetical protein